MQLPSNEIGYLWFTKQILLHSHEDRTPCQSCALPAVHSLSQHVVDRHTARLQPTNESTT